MLNKIFNFLPLQIECFQAVPYDRKGSSEFPAQSLVCFHVLTAESSHSTNLQHGHLTSHQFSPDLVPWSQMSIPDGTFPSFRKDEGFLCVTFQF